MKRRTGFTLIELLFIIAIIAILASLLLPSLSRAKSTSRTIMCSGHLRQWAVATNIYVDSWQEYLPPHQMGTASLESYTYWNRWESWLRDAFLPKSTQAQYLKGNEINGCPEHSNAPLGTSTSTTIRLYSYGESYDICNQLSPINPYGTRLYKLNHITAPGRTIQNTDMSNDINAPGYRFSASPERVGYLHLGKTNCLFVDGHVEGKRQNQLSNNDYIP